MLSLPVAPVDSNTIEEDENFIPPATTTTSSSDSSSVSMATDYEIIRIVMKEIAEYLQSIEPLNAITEPVVQRIATIIISHLNNALNERLLLTNFRRIDRDRLLVKLRAFAGNRSKFLRHIEHYLQITFMDGGVGVESSEVMVGMSSSVEREYPVGENQEVLLLQQKAQKKQNNEPGNGQVTRSSVLVQQVSEEDEQEEDEPEGAANGIAEGNSSVVSESVNLVQIESSNDDTLGEEVSKDKEGQEEEDHEVSG